MIQNSEDNQSVNPPLISVIILTYNQEKFISKTLESVLSQHTNFKYEVIVAEDFSSDKTGEICREYENKYPEQIRLHLGKENVGAHHRFLEAVQLAKGKYIGLCEGDDYWTDPDKLQMEYEVLEKHADCPGVHTKVIYVDDKDEIIGESDLVPEGANTVSFDYLVQKNAIHTCSFMFRKSIFNETADSILRSSPVSDYALFLIAAINGDIYYINQITGAYRKEVGVTTSWKHKEYIKCRLAVYSLIEKYLDVKGHKAAIHVAKQFQYFHLFSIQGKEKGRISRCQYLLFLFWYTFLSSIFPPQIRVHEIGVIDVIRLVFKSRFRIKKRRNCLRTGGDQQR